MASNDTEQEELLGQLAEAEERPDQAEAELAPTVLAQYLRLVQQHLVPTLLLHSNATNFPCSSDDVDGNYYPQELCVWDEFKRTYRQIFNQSTELFFDKPLFYSRNHVRGAQENLSWTPDGADFILAAIEKPAYRVVSAYLEHSDSSNAFFLQYNPCSLKRGNDQPGPYRWGIVDSTNGNCRHVFVGVFNTGYLILPEEVTQVLASAPKDFFQRVLQRRQSMIVNSKEEEIRERIAQLLCKTFHYMLRSGILYGYIVAGPTLIFLKIDAFAPQRLYFHFTSVTTGQGASEIDVQDLPTSQLASFAISTLHSREMPREWIVQVENCDIPRWPFLPQNENSQRVQSGRDENAEDPGDFSHVASSIEQSNYQYTAKPPALEYCTQACLIGLVDNLSLDQNCPNAALHQQNSSYDQHPITREELCFLTRQQLSNSLDNDCESLDKKGMYGAMGVLFKITLTTYGYTFVAKGVKEVHEPAIARELNIYSHALHLQGVDIPVCLGSFTLERPYPLVSLAEVTHMMLMSWGGRNLLSTTWAENVDITKEKEKTLKALISSGIHHKDIRESNLVWNPERQKVMVIDFDQATIIPTYVKRKRGKKTAA